MFLLVRWRRAAWNRTHRCSVVACRSRRRRFRRAWSPCPPGWEAGCSWRRPPIGRWSCVLLWNRPLEFQGRRKTWLRARTHNRRFIAAGGKSFQTYVTTTTSGSWVVLKEIYSVFWITYAPSLFSGAAILLCTYVNTAVACRSRCHWPRRSEQPGRRARTQASSCSSRCCPIRSRCLAMPHYWRQEGVGRSPLIKRKETWTKRQRKKGGGAAAALGISGDWIHAKQQTLFIVQ